VYAIHSPPGLISADETVFIPRISSGVTGPAESVGTAKQIASVKVSASADIQLKQVRDVLFTCHTPVEGPAGRT
jgi:hypothetical protein